MYIVHVVRQFHPGIGGLENFVMELASAQVADGHIVRVVTLDRLFNAAAPERLPPRERVGGIEIVRIPFFGSRRYPIAWSVIKHVRNADILHVHGIDFFFDYLAVTAPLHRRTLVVSTHGGFFHTRFAALLKKIYFSTITRVALTRYGRRRLPSASTDYALFGGVRSHGLAADPENGVNIAKFAAAAPARPPERGP